MSNSTNSQSVNEKLQSEQLDYMGAAECFVVLLEAFQTGNLKVLFDLMAEDAVMEFPFAPPNRPRRVEGKDNIIEYNQKIMGLTKFTGCSDLEIHRTIDPDCIIVEMTLQGIVAATGDTLERRYIDVFRTKNGRIQLIRDYWNPQESPTKG